MHGHDIPDTEEIRAKIDTAQSESIERLGIDPKVVAVFEDGFRSAEEVDSSFEWWYFDMQLDDGSTLVATFNTKPHTAPDGPLDPSVLIIYHGADGTKIRADTKHSDDGFSASVDRCDVRIGPNSVSGDLEKYEIHLEEQGVVADIELVRGAPSWRPGAGVTYFDSENTEFLGWVVPVPYGTVTGTISVNGDSRTITGSAYHDHNWGNKVMEAGLDHWYWGRAHIGDYTVVYVRMTTKGLFGLGSINIPTFLLAKGDTVITDDMLPLRLETTGNVAGPGHQHYPSQLDWAWHTDEGSVTMRVTNPEMIEALEMPKARHGIAHAVLSAFEHPMYYDFNADMELSIDLGGIKETIKGRTLFEKMMFR